MGMVALLAAPAGRAVDGVVAVDGPAELAAGVDGIGGPRLLRAGVAAGARAAAGFAAGSAAAGTRLESLGSDQYGEHHAALPMGRKHTLNLVLGTGSQALHQIVYLLLHHCLLLWGHLGRLLGFEGVVNRGSCCVWKVLMSRRCGWLWVVMENGG